MRRLSAFIALLSLAILGIAASAEAQQSWVEYRPAGEGYRVEFPAVPKITKEDINSHLGKASFTYAEYESKGGFILVAMQTVYPSSPPDPQAFLDIASASGVKSANATLREEKRLTVGGKPARRMIMEMPDKLVGVALVVLNGNHLYNTMAVVPQGQESSADVQRFIESFALVPM